MSVNPFSARTAWSTPSFRPPEALPAFRAAQPLSATSQLGTVVRGGFNGMQSTYVSSGDLNSFSIQSAGGRNASVTGLATLGDQVRLYYASDGQIPQAVTLNSAQLAEQIRTRDEALKTLYGKVNEFNADGVITPDERQQFGEMSDAIRALQARLMLGIDAALGASSGLGVVPRGLPIRGYDETLPLVRDFEPIAPELRPIRAFDTPPIVLQADSGPAKPLPDFTRLDTPPIVLQQAPGSGKPPVDRNVLDTPPTPAPSGTLTLSGSDQDRHNQMMGIISGPYSR